MATRRDSDSSSQRSPNRKKKSPLKTSTNLEEKSSEKTTRKQNKKKDGKLRNTRKEKLCKGEVQKKIERFEKHSEVIYEWFFFYMPLLLSLSRTLFCSHNCCRNGSMFVQVCTVISQEEQSSPGHVSIYEKEKHSLQNISVDNY